MKDGGWTVSICDRYEIKDFIETYHYSKSINGLMSSYCFKLEYNNELKGAMLYGKLGMANVWKKYSNNPNNLLELRRLCLVDNTPKNAESYFIGRSLRWLKQNTNIKKIVSYADPNYGHQGIIYQATNFIKLGYTSPGKVIIWNNKKYHDKAIRTKYKGKLKPFAEKLSLALERGEAYYKKQQPKIIYVYSIDKA